MSAPSETGSVSDVPSLDAAQLSAARLAYVSDGACCLRGVVSGEWIATLRKGVGTCESNPSPLSKTWRSESGPGRLFQDVFAWRNVHTFERFAREATLSQVVAKVIGSNTLRLYSDHVLVRSAGTAKETPWHQDAAYCFVAGEHFCSVWTPLNPVKASAGLRVLAGSHRENRLFIPIEFGSAQHYDHTATGEREQVAHVPSIVPSDPRILTWEMNAGDAILFSSKSLHGFPQTDGLPLQHSVYVTRWVGDDARFTRHPWTVPPLPFDPALSVGAPLTGPLFPQVFSEKPDVRP